MCSGPYPRYFTKFPRRGTSTNRHEEKKIAVSLEFVDEFALTQLRTSNRNGHAQNRESPSKSGDAVRRMTSRYCTPLKYSFFCFHSVSQRFNRARMKKKSRSDTHDDALVIHNGRSDRNGYTSCYLHILGHRSIPTDYIHFSQPSAKLNSMLQNHIATWDRTYDLTLGPFLLTTRLHEAMTCCTSR